MKQTRSVMACFGKQSMLFVSIALAAAIADAAEGGKSVFSDAAVWIKGAYDGTGTAGVIDPGDIRHAMDMSTAITGSAVYGGAINRQHVREDVLCPYAGTVVSNVPCINLAQTVVDGKCNWTSLQLAGDGGPVSVTDCCATVVARIRPDGFTTPDKAYWLFGGIGFQVGFAENPEKPGWLRMRGYCGNWQTTDFHAEPGTWIDVAVVRESENGFRFYAVTNGVMWSQYKSATGIGCGIKTALYLGLNQNGNNNGAVDIDSTSNFRRLSYRGLIQSFAVWNRRLADVEIREAFAYPRTDMMRIGVANGSGGEFVKAAPDGAKVNPDDWYTMPAALAPGEAVDIDFAIKAHEAALPQVLRLTSLAGSAGGLDVSVNGTAVGEPLMSVPGATKTLFLPGELFRAGANTLHLANTSPRTVLFDALALGGSWQLGIDDNARSEFGGSAVVNSYADEGNWKHIRGIATSSPTTITAVVPPELAASGHPAVFRVKAFTAYRYSAQYYPEPMTCQLIVNGIEKASFTLGDYPGSEQHFETFTAKIKAGELRPGTNTFAMAAQAPGAGGNQSYLGIDWWRIEMKPLPKGFVFLCK